MYNESTWNSFKRVDFKFEGRSAILVCPDKPREGNPWVFRAEFFGAFPSADIALVKEGFYIAYIDNSNRFGSDGAVELMKRFQEYLITEFNLNKKSVVFGFSRGGLYTVNYAAKYPQNVAVLYLDAPVLNILSWPCALGITLPDRDKYKTERTDCLKEYNITISEAIAYRGNPLDKVDVMVRENLPIIIVAGLIDSVVPYAENSEIFIKKYKELSGNRLKLIVKENCDHHPHSLDDPTPIVEFILENM